MKIRLEIERLVLEGYSPAEGRALAASLERELGRLVEERGLPPAWGGRVPGGTVPGENSEISRLDGGSLPLSPAALPRDVGSRLAHRVYGGQSPGGGAR